MAAASTDLDDSRLAARVHAGDEAAFAELYDRHHKALLSFCRHMLGNVQDGEDALQQTFIRAHRALVAGQLPDAMRPWLFAIARNRCKTMLAARRDATVPVEDVEPSFDGIVGRRRAARRPARAGRRPRRGCPRTSAARWSCSSSAACRRPRSRRAIGVPAGKVKALVFQARTELMAERDARLASCESIREELAVARGGALRRGPLKRHLRQCEPCDAFRAAIAAQRTGLASILPVAPALGLKAAILAAGATSGHGGAAAGVAGGGARRRRSGTTAAAPRTCRQAAGAARARRRSCRRRSAAGGAAAAARRRRRSGRRRHRRRRSDRRRSDRRRGHRRRGGAAADAAARQRPAATAARRGGGVAAGGAAATGAAVGGSALTALVAKVAVGGRARRRHRRGRRGRGRSRRGARGRERRGDRDRRPRQPTRQPPRRP